MHKLALLAALAGLLCVTALPSHAQGWPGGPGGPSGPVGPGGFHGGPGGPGGPGERSGRGFGRLAAALALSPGQMSKIKPFFDAGRAKMMVLRGNTTLTPQQKFAKMKKIHDWQTAMIAPFLTPEQMAKWKAMQARRPGGPGGWGGRPGGPGGPGGHPSGFGG